MKKAVKILIIILSIIILICLAVLIIVNKNEENNEEYSEEITPPKERYTKTKEKYECNEFEYINVSTDDLIVIYFNKYKENMIYNIEKAYDTLDDNYRQKRFGNIEEYKKYVNNNYEHLISLTLNSYKVDATNNDYIQYICIDQDNNYYIFRETAIMQYKILLDTYTLELPEFSDKYNSTNEQGKMALNIQKFMQSINLKDYNYAYNCLSDGFKNNYFNSVEDFEKYISENLYNNNETEYKEFQEEGGLYKYKITITDTENKNNTIEKTIIMKLNEGTDFELSFNV